MSNDTSTNPDLTQQAEAVTDQHSSLPRGWEQRTTPAGRVYYINHNTRITTWNDPRDPVRNTENTTAPVSPESPPLPAGWEANRQPDGTVYYTDHNTRSTTYEDPRGRIGANDSAQASL